MTLFANGPTCTRLGAKLQSIGILWYVAFNPIQPHRLAGMRIDPPPSDPIATGTKPIETAAAGPDELPPVKCSSLYGLRQVP